MKKEAAKKFPGHEKMLLDSRRHHVKTACRLRQRCVGIKIKLCPRDGPR